jgi:uncharacterized protein (DUF1330 family)
VQRKPTHDNTRLHLIYGAVLLAAVMVSYLVTRQLTADNVPYTAVYLIGAVTITDPERLPEYQAIAGPLAAEAGGYLPLAFASPNMIEGEPPTHGLYFIERYDSLAGLRAFVESEAFLEAKTLRDEVADVHFMMWLPALPADALPH